MSELLRGHSTKGRYGEWGWWGGSGTSPERRGRCGILPLAGSQTVKVQVRRRASASGWLQSRLLNILSPGASTLGGFAGLPYAFALCGLSTPCGIRG